MVCVTEKPVRAIYFGVKPPLCGWLCYETEKNRVIQLDKGGLALIPQPTDNEAPDLLYLDRYESSEF
jgi:hypothetical protein